VTGSTLSPSFPTKRALFPKLNRGVPNSCCICSVGFTAFFPAIDAFLTKLNPSGSSLVYSTYLGGIGEDGARAVAVDSQGNAYVTGETCSPDFPTPGTSSSGEQSNIFLVKVSSSGRAIVYGKVLNAARVDAGSSVAVDSAGNAYVTGDTQSEDLPVMTGAFQTKLAGSVAFATSDSALNWSAINSGLPNQTVNAIAVDPTNPATVYAASSFAVYKSTDAGATWKTAHANGGGLYIAIDPTASTTVYAGPFMSTDAGSSWSNIVLPPTTGFVNILAVDPKNASNLFAGTGGFGGDVPTGGGVYKSTDAGATWRNVTPPAFTSFVLVVFIDPKTPTTIYANAQRLLKSTDGGVSWSPTGLESTPVSAAGIAVDGAGAAVQEHGRRRYLEADRAERNLYQRDCSKPG
jgi:hypothetical protein